MNTKFRMKATKAGGVLAGAAAAVAFAPAANAQTYDAATGTYSYGAEAAQAVAVATAQATTNAVIANVGSHLNSIASGIAGGATGAGPTPGGAQTSKLMDTAAQGTSAGSTDKPYSVWANITYTSIKDDFRRGATDTRFDGDVYVFGGGFDYFVTKEFLAGVALQYLTVDIDTTFQFGKTENDGVNISPYLMYFLNRNVSLVALGGYSYEDSDRNRRNAAGGTLIRGNTDADSVYGSASAIYNQFFDRVHVNASLGWLQLHREEDGFRESDGTNQLAQSINLGQFQVGGQLGYNFGMVEPYALVQYSYDAVHNSDTTGGAGGANPKHGYDSDGFDVGGGMRFNPTDFLSGYVEGKSVLGRDNTEIWSVTGTLRLRF